MRPPGDRPFVPVLALVLLAGTVPAARAGRTDEPLRPRIEEQVHVYLVEMSVLATDKAGNPIRDLGRDEVLIRERGEEQEVAVLMAAGEQVKLSFVNEKLSPKCLLNVCDMAPRFPLIL